MALSAKQSSKGSERNQSFVISKTYEEKSLFGNQNLGCSLFYGINLPFKTKESDSSNMYAPSMTYLTHTNPELNKQRFYTMKLQPDLFGGWSLVREFGRIGHAGGRVILRHFESLEAAQKARRKLCGEKLKLGYQEI